MAIILSTSCIRGASEANTLAPVAAPDSRHHTKNLEALCPPGAAQGQTLFLWSTACWLQLPWGAVTEALPYPAALAALLGAVVIKAPAPVGTLGLVWPGDF